MLPTINDAKALTQRMGLTGAIIVGFAADGKFVVSSYGATKSECSRLARINDWIFEYLQRRYLKPSDQRTEGGG